MRDLFQGRVDDRVGRGGAACTGGGGSNANIRPAQKAPSPVAWVPSTRSPMALYNGKGLVRNFLTNFALLTLSVYEVYA